MSELRGDGQPGRGVEPHLLRLERVPRRPARGRRLPAREVLVAVERVRMALIPNSE